MSFDGPLNPVRFFDRTRTKYVPAVTLVTVSDTAALPVSKLARSASPDADPASITYDESASPPDGAVHVSTTTSPVIEAVTFVGTPGADAAARTDASRIGDAVAHSAARNVSVETRHPHVMVAASVVVAASGANCDHELIVGRAGERLDSHAVTEPETIATMRIRRGRSTGECERDHNSDARRSRAEST